jgi:hypothetical protein
MNRSLLVTALFLTACFQPVDVGMHDAGSDGGVSPCTVGMDQTCNELATMSALAGTCSATGCTCAAGFERGPTGKCRPLNCSGSAPLCLMGTVGGLCGDAATLPVCQASTWVCPQGTIPSTQCACSGDRGPGCICTAQGWSCADAGTMSCTPGIAMSCNDGPLSDGGIGGLAGTCSNAGICTCLSGFELNPANGRCRAVNLPSLEWVNDTSTRTTLAVISTGMANNTPVLFKVSDSMGRPVQGVDVDFLMAPNSAAGCNLLPLRVRTDALGIARTTLFSGESQGTATVIARVVGLPEARSTNFDIVIGRVNEGRMQLSCNRATLGALISPSPPRVDQNATCTVSLVDRGGRNPPFALNVSWLTEAGNIPPMSTSTPGAPSVSAVFNTGGSLPVSTTPLPAVSGPFAAPQEPSFGANNPRDNFVSIVAAVQGEEEFWDGSGSSRGLTNGTWDPGEYWVDLAEPFADNNDNGRWDPGEAYIDADRTNCLTGMVEPMNNRWDPPNGCWDRATQVWKTTHIVYSDGPAWGAGVVGTFLRFSPQLPSFMAVDTLQQISITWTDRYFNRFSKDSASINVANIAGTRGSATIANSGIAGEAFGHQLEYFAVRAQVSNAGTVLAEEGICDPQEPDSGYPDVRCLRTYRFRDWRTSPPNVTMTLVAPMAQAALSDGGVPPATNTTWELRAANGLQVGPSTHQFTVAFPP